MRGEVTENLFDLMTQHDLIEIPKFQRRYSWKPQHWQDLLDDIKNTERISEDYHFFGTIVLSPAKTKGIKKSYDLLDGQQRIATVSLLFIAIRDLLKERGVTNIPEVDEIDSFLTARSKASGDSKKRKLTLSKEEDKIYNNLWDSSAPDKRYSLTKAYLYFKNYLEDKEDEKLNDIVYKVCNQFRVIVLPTGKYLDPYDIFESMNDRGAPLGTLDLVRNSILSRAEKIKSESEDYHKSISDIWSNIEDVFKSTKRTRNPEIFFRLHCICNIESKLVPKGRKTYRKLRDHANKLTDSKFVKYIDELHISLENYVNIKEANFDEYLDNKSYANQLNYLCDEVNYLGASRLHLILLKLVNKKYGIKEINKIIAILKSYIARVKITGASTAPEESNYLKVLKILDSKKQNKITAISKLINKTIKQNDLTKTQVIENVKESFQNNHSLAKYILCKIERSRTHVDKPNEFSLTTEDNLEHIYPQTPMKGKVEILKDKVLLHSIGNLLILERGINSKLSNKSFSEKLKLYKDSKHSITEDISKVKKWSDKEIKNRTNKLAKEFAKILDNELN